MRLSVRSAFFAGSLGFLLAGCKGTEPPVASSLVVSAPSLTFSSINETQSLTASVLDQNGKTMPGQAISYSSNNTIVATVAPNGLVQARANGTATITASGAGTLTQNVSVTVAQVPATLAKSGDNQTGTQGTALTTPITMNVKDAGGTNIPGATVTFAVTGGGGSMSSNTAVTNASGNASVTWTLGPNPGANTASATVGSLTAQVFTATGVAPGQPATIEAAVGISAQTALVGYRTNFRPAVRVLDGNGSPLPGINVTFAVTSGGGSGTGLTVVTNALGVAQVGGWTVGGSAGANTMTATIAGTVTGNPVTFTANGVVSGFAIVIQNVGPPFSPAVQAAFDSATAFWSRVIIGDLADHAVNSAAGQCGPGSPAFASTVDDVVIMARFDSIDGPSNILGQASPCFIRGSGPNLPLTTLGFMSFDTADVAGMISSGSLNAVIRHEMGHVLGFGTLWDPPPFLGCLQNQSSGGNVQDTYYACTNGRLAFDSIGGTSYTGGSKVPLENCGPTSPSGCGQGTRNSHWREPTFLAELMTGYLNSGVPNPASLLTVAAMSDLGYTVNYGAAEAYTRVFSVSPLLAAASLGVLVPLGDDRLRIPITATDQTGRVVRVYQP